MKRLPLVVGGVLLLWASTTAVIAQGGLAPTTTEDDPSSLPTFRYAPQGVTSRPAALSKAESDTVYLMGGPGALSGKFQTSLSPLAGLPDAQGWTSLDVTEPAIYWHVSTFNAESFAGSGATNRAMFSGVEPGTPGFVAAPGYGNNWDDNLVFSESVDANASNTARLQFQFHHDTEAGWDFFFVDYDSSGTWTTINSYSGISDTTGTFLTPAIFDETVSYAPGTAGLNGNRVRFRLRFLSDGNTSDQDGLLDTDGAVQVDNIRVTINGTEASFADFDGSPGDADWETVRGLFVGDFGKLFLQFSDPDPCRSNLSPCIGFIDNGMDPNNAPGQSTGGTLSPTYDYGIPGGWVLNYTGGLSDGTKCLTNEWWSPEIEWDLPGTDDDAAVGGAAFGYTSWEHLPLAHGMLWYWGVRSYPNESGEWSPWLDRGSIYFSPVARYFAGYQDVSDLLVSAPEKVQIRFGVEDITCWYPVPGGDATPAPLFDNISLLRYGAPGPAFDRDYLDFFNDAFPQSGSTYATADDPLDLAIRLDAANDRVRSQGSSIVPGDSMVIRTVAVVPGTELVGPPEMIWVLDANPLFDGDRTLPAGATVLTTFTGPDGRTWNRWTGSLVGEVVTTANGTVQEDLFSFDLPDGRARRNFNEPDEPGMFYPGDELRWHFRAEDTGGNVTTDPSDVDLAAFQDGTWGDTRRVIDVRPFELHGLPTIVDPEGDGTVTQPKILFVNDFGHRGSEDDFLQAFHQNGLFENVDWDCYTVRRPDAQQSNGIGSAGTHGALPDQIAGYDVIFYDSGDLASLSDGTVGENKAQDVQLLTSWKNQPGNRYTVHFGDDIASTLSGAGTDALTYMSAVMGVNYRGSDFRNLIDGQTAPVAVPTGDVPGLTTGFIAYGGCLDINRFDHIEPLANSERTHAFLKRDGSAAEYDPAPGIWYARTAGETGQYQKVDVTFPFGLRYLWNSPDSDSDPKSVRADLFAQLLTSFGKIIDDSDATNVTPMLPSRLLGSHPNPFNPSTEIELRMGVPGRFALRVYNVRGELVRTLLDEELDPGLRSITWDGTDHQGRLVGSGVYLTKFTGPDVNDASKILLVK